MLVNIKPHSSLVKYFSGSCVSADINTYSDLILYLHSMQPKLVKYLLDQQKQENLETIAILDSNYRILSSDDLLLRTVKEEETIHIVPAIMGGGGKRGTVIALVAAVALFAVAGPLGNLLAPALSSAAAGGATTVAAASTAASITAGITNIAINIGLAALANLFAPGTTTPETNRQNDAFGSLTNTTSSGIPIGLNYGMVRVAGQMISGYINSINHNRGETVTVEGELI